MPLPPTIPRDSPEFELIRPESPLNDHRTTARMFAESKHWYNARKWYRAQHNLPTHCAFPDNFVQLYEAAMANREFYIIKKEE